MGRWAVSITLVAVSAIPCWAQEVDLTPRFEAGRTQYVEICQDQEQMITGAMAGEAGIKVKNNSCYSILQKVEKSDASGAKLKLTFDRASLSLAHSMMGEMKFDSDAPAKEGEESTLSKIFKPWVGKSLQVDTNAAGMATNVGGYDELLEAMEESAAGDMQYEMMKGSFTADDFKASYHDFRYAALPPKKVKVGDSWNVTRQHKDSTFGEVVIDYACKLTKVDGDAATVQYAATVKSAPGATPPSNGMGMKPVLNSWTIKGELAVDAKRGEPTSQTEEHQMDTQLLFVQGGEGGEQKLDMKMHGKTTSRMLDEKARAAQKMENSTPKPAPKPG